MKKNHRHIENFVWEHMSLGSMSSGIGGRMRKLIGSLLALLCIFYLLYSVTLLLKAHRCWHSISCTTDCLQTEPLPIRLSKASEEDNSKGVIQEMVNPSFSSDGGPNGTDLKHIVFGIAASARLWQKRKEYTKLWWRPAEMRGFVWLDRPVMSGRNRDREALSLPRLKISSSTSRFKYTNERGHRSALRISRIVSETFRLGLPDVHWFVMGDDDTVFVVENLVRVLSKYDHRQFYYIGSVSESHLQNVYFSYNMAYGGGGFAISYPLAKALESMQDGCIQRYPGLYGSDDRVQACMAELGVPLTREPGFHQFDVYGNLFGLLAAHPISPLVSLHHLDVVEPVFPNLTRLQALQHLLKPIKLDSAGILQQSICYDGVREWSFSVSWGYAVQIFRGIFSPREMEMPSRTFLNWYRRADFTAYAFNTRPVSRHPCQKPFVFYMKDVRHDRSEGHIISNYTRQNTASPQCRWKMASPETIDWIQVVKKPSAFSGQQSPRRNCCRVIQSRRRSIDIEVGDCKEGEIIGL